MGTLTNQDLFVKNIRKSKSLRATCGGFLEKLMISNPFWKSNGSVLYTHEQVIKHKEDSFFFLLSHNIGALGDESLMHSFE